MKPGDYVRTENGIIARIRNIIDYEKPNEKKYLNYNDMCVLTNDWNNDVAGCRGEIIKSSSNIIDLIEVGDIIKFGYVYTQTKEVKNIKVHRIKNEADLTLQKFYFNNKKRVLKSIVTKEQFESIEYKIGE